MSDLIEESLKIEKDFKDKIREALIKGANNEIKIETISIAGMEYFNAKLKFIIRFYEENKQIQQAFAEEKIEKEIENHRKRHVLDSFSEKEMNVLNNLIKNRETTTSVIANETKHTWITVEGYLKKFKQLGIIEEVKTGFKRIKKYRITEDYDFIKEEFLNHFVK